MQLDRQWKQYELGLRLQFVVVKFFQQFIEFIEFVVKFQQFEFKQWIVFFQFGKFIEQQLVVWQFV